MKKVVVQFDFPQGTQEQYDGIWSDLRASGNGNPKGLLYHVGAPKPNGGWMVFDVWESAEDFQAFGNTLMPLIQKNNIKPVPPFVYNVHNIYEAGK
jgi:hypothetical protein